VGLPQRRQPFEYSWSYSWTVFHHHNSPLKALSKTLGNNADNSSPVADCNSRSDASLAWTLSRYAIAKGSKSTILKISCRFNMFTSVMQY
jgi:hypothetical protein